MCGIVGYVGFREAAPILLGGLRRLEYRGYDSAGIATLHEGKLYLLKAQGRVDDLLARLNGRRLPGHIGIAHTRWATHGEPSDINAHPHTDMRGIVALIHNGIIENYASLRTELERKGYAFRSQTDTEVLAHLIEAFWIGCDFETAVRRALSLVVGAYGLAIISPREPDTLIIARKGSPLILGIGEGEYIVASDASAIVEHTRQVIYLEDGEMAIVRPTGYVVKSIENVEKTKEICTIEWSLEQIERGGFEHFMLKEIFEQPTSLENTLRGRIHPGRPEVQLGGLLPVWDRLLQARRIILVGCGTSWHAGLVGEYLIESLARIPVEVEYASEFRYRDPILYPDDVVIAISQSGETADTLAAVREARARGALVLGICNVVGSSIARETEAGVYLHAGPEIGVASTKAFTSQVAVLAMLALMLARGRTLTDAEILVYVEELYQIPEKIRRILDIRPAIQELAQRFKDVTNFLYLGRGPNFPVALEGALKLKEISYIHAEGYPAAEMKHGPIALIDENMPVVFIALHDGTYEKILSNIQEVRARRGQVIAITDALDPTLEELASAILQIPGTLDPFTPLLAVVPLQLLAYEIAVLRGCDVDKPRNLAKSVTVE
jgi:glucosamine--fructose-6-phosphate aminotransferase (isomerizing)